MRGQSPILIVAAAALAACGSEPDPAAQMERELAEAIDVWHDQRPACLSLRPAPPTEVRADRESAERTRMDALVSAGLATAAETTRETRGFGAVHETVYIVYEPTPDASEAIRPHHDSFLGGSQLCYARRQLDDIQHWTEPGDIMGVNVTQVSYSWTLEDIAPWADNDDIRAAFPAIAQALDDPRGEDTEAFIRTNTGWIHERQFSGR